MKAQDWKTLADAQLVSGEQPKSFEIGSPWYIKILLAFSGWLAAIFILGLLFSVFSRFSNNTPLLITFGCSFIVIAYFLLRIKASEFFEHLAFALSIAGMVLLTISIDNLITYNEEALMWLIIAVVQLFLTFIMPNFVHRVLSSFASAVSFAGALFFYHPTSSGIAIYSVFLMLITALVWLNEFRYPKQIEKLQAIGYGLVGALIVIKATRLFMHTPYWYTHNNGLQQNTWFQPWMDEVALSAISLFVVWKLLQKIQPSKLAILLALGGTLALSLLSTQAQGLIVGFMILLLGFAASNRILITLGVIALLFFISSYYYLLDNTLLDKSITLLVLGIALISGRWIMLRLLPNSHTALKGEAL